uniref:Dirigent protein n=1 Tax=Arundo donax TaxID=35708 RepID=A0A0A9FGW1_ARUDO
MVFEDGSFEGSTLQVMGPDVERGEWAIIGGTGEFTLAQGVIYKTLHEQRGEGNIMEIDIHAIYTPMERSQSNSGKNVWNLGV